MLRTIKPGDYLITKDNELYRIMNVEVYGGHTSYTIKSLKSSVEFIETFAHKYYKEIKGLSHSGLRHLGTIIPEEEASKTLNLLYES